MRASREQPCGRSRAWRRAPSLKSPPEGERPEGEDPARTPGQPRGLPLHGRSPANVGGCARVSSGRGGRSPPGLPVRLFRVPALSPSQREGGLRLRERGEDPARTPWATTRVAPTWDGLLPTSRVVQSSPAGEGEDRPAPLVRLFRVPALSPSQREGGLRLRERGEDPARTPGQPRGLPLHGTVSCQRRGLCKVLQRERGRTAPPCPPSVPPKGREVYGGPSQRGEV